MRFSSRIYLERGIFADLSLKRKLRFLKGCIEDVVIRRALRDPHTLPFHLRREKSYLYSRQMGEDVVRWVRSHTGTDFAQSMRILDVGSGDGRVAAAIAARNPNLVYTGLEVNPHWVRALNARYRNSSYAFIHANVRNDYYSTSGSSPARTYRFPFEDRQFDLVIANALFDHLYPEGTRNYLKEVGRVLVSDGVAWATFAVWRDDDSSDDVSKACYPYRHVLEGGYRAISAEVPLLSLAYPQARLEEMVAGAGLTIVRMVPGWWRDRGKAGLDLNQHAHDVVILRRAAGG